MALQTKNKNHSRWYRAKTMKQWLINNEFVMNLVAGFTAGLLSGIVAYLASWILWGKLPSGETPMGPMNQAMQITGLGPITTLLAFAAIFWLWVGNRDDRNSTQDRNRTDKYFTQELSRIFLAGALFSWSAFAGILIVISFVVRQWNVMTLFLLVSISFTVVTLTIYYVPKQSYSSFWNNTIVKIIATLAILAVTIFLLNDMQLPQAQPS